jgi:hypothetical protein
MFCQGETAAPQRPTSLSAWHESLLQMFFNVNEHKITCWADPLGLEWALECTFLTSSQVMLMLLDQGPPLGETLLSYYSTTKDNF